MGKQARLRRERKQFKTEWLFDIDQFCAMYCKVAPAIIYKHLDESCCLNATRILIDVGKAFGVEFKPLVVRAVAMNQKNWQLLREHGTFPQDPEVLNSWINQGAYSVLIDVMEDSDAQANGMELKGWSGHLVGVCGNILVDSSARQLSRPAHAMPVSDVVVMRVPDNFLINGTVTAEAPHGTILNYRAVPSVTRYETMSGFQRHEGNADIARLIMLEMDKLLPAEWVAKSRPKIR